MKERIRVKSIIKTRFGKKPSTEWLEACEDHLTRCDDPKCHIRRLAIVIDALEGEAKQK